jgi:MYXO-CTERM domain-containing protein
MMGTTGNLSHTTTFQQMTNPIHGTPNATLSLLTFADDGATSGEDIYFNGVDIGGPIDANLPGGGSASIFNFNVTSFTGSANSATLTSTGDIFGWHVAVLQTPVPEPSGIALAALALLALAGFVRRRR